MKKLFSMLILLIMVFMVGCGSKAADPSGDLTIKWDGVSYTYGDTALNFSTYTGSMAQVDMPTGTYLVTIDTAKDVTNITVNNQGILEENMDKYKDVFYYQEYLGSKTTGAMLIGPDTWAVAQTGGGTPAILAKEMHEIFTALPLTNACIYVNVADQFTFGNAYDKTECRLDKILIPQVAQVLPGQINPNMEPYTFTKTDGTSVSGLYGPTAAYDYYFYGGYTIQLYKGGNIYDYVKFN